MRVIPWLFVFSLFAGGPALAVPTNPGEHGLFDAGAQTPGSEGIPTTADLSAYLPKTGGDMTGDIYLRNGVSIYACSRSDSCANLYASGNQTLTWYGVGDINVGGGGGFSALSLGGTGNAYACLNSSGKIYRSATACQ